MFIKRIAFNEIHKRLAEYRDTNYELQLENETLREYKDNYDCAKAEFEMDIQYRESAAETKVVRKDGKALIELWLKSETLKRLRMLAHKQLEAFLSRDEEIATYIEKLIDGVEEVNFKKGRIFGATKRKLIVDITGTPFTFCCDELKEFAKSHYFYLHFQIRDMKKLDPTNPCLILGDGEGNKSWYTCCPFCHADIMVKEVKRKNKAEEGEVEEK